MNSKSSKAEKKGRQPFVLIVTQNAGGGCVVRTFTARFDSKRIARQAAAYYQTAGCSTEFGRILS